MGVKDEWHTIARKSWWDGSMVALCGVRFKGGEWTSEDWFLPKTGKDCKKCAAIKESRGK